MRTAVLTDVHGNTVALEAVIADGRDVGVDRWWVLGDLVAMGPDPGGTVAVLRELDPEVRILGNTERYVLHDELPFEPTAELELTPSLVDQMVETAASFAWTKGSLCADDLRWLALASVRHADTLLDGSTVLLVHASAIRDDGPGVDPTRTAHELCSLFPGVADDLVLAGHTHHVTDRVVNGTRFVNPGSVSNHVTNDRRANYVVLDDDSDGYEIEFRSVPYDVDHVIEQLTSSAMPGRRFVLEQYFGQ